MTHFIASFFVALYLLTIPVAIGIIDALIAVFWPIAICLSFLYGIFHKETNHND